MKHLKKLVVMILTVLMCTTNFTTILAEDEETTAESPSFTVSYEFVLEGSEEKLPEEVMAKLPDPIPNLHDGDVVENKAIEDVASEDVTYSFLGWSSDTVTVKNGDVTVTGTWKKKAAEILPEKVTQFGEQQTTEDSTNNENTITVTYMFLEAYHVDSGNLPRAVMDLLPEGKTIPRNGDQSPEKMSVTQVGEFSWQGWNPYHDEDGNVTYFGIWMSPDSHFEKPGRKGLLRAGSTRTFVYSGYWTVPNDVGYSGESRFTLDGEVAYCIEPDKHMDNSYKGAIYEESGSIGGEIARIAVMGMYNGVDEGSIQAAIWNSIKGTSAGGADCQPDYSGYDDSGWEVPDCPVYTCGSKQSLILVPSPTPSGGFVKVYKRAAAVNGINYASAFPNNYSLAGAVYGVYSNSACTNLVASLTTGAGGETGTTGALDPDTYYVKEISASPGFKLDPNIYPVSVSAGDTSSITSTETPINDPMAVRVFKKDRRDSKWVNHLDEAQFTVKYYDTKINDPRSLTPKLTFVYKSSYNTEGDVYSIFGNPDYYVGGDDITPYIVGGKIYFPLGTITIEETMAPKLFAADPNLYVGHINQTGENAQEAVDYFIDENGNVNPLTDGSAWILDIDNVDLSQNEELQTVNLIIQKVDQETGKAELPKDHITSTATLSGGVFHIYRIGEYNTDKDNPQLIDITPVDYGTIVTDETGKAELRYERINGVDTTDGLLPGKFRIVEEKAPAGFTLKPTLAENTYTISAPVKERNTASFQYSMDIGDKLTRIQIEKLDQDGDLVSGEATATIQLVETDTGRVVYEFVADGQSHIIKGLTTLMNYHLHELYVAPNYKLAIDKEVNVIDENDSELHTSTDDEHPYSNYYHMVDHEVEIHTTATVDETTKKEWDNQDDHHYVADGVAHIFDEVSYKNVYENETYKLVGELWDKTDDRSLGNVVEKEFTPKYDVGIEILEFKQQLDDLDNHELVVFETLYRIVTHEGGSTEEIKVVEHKDLDDEDQTIHVDELYRRDFEIVKVNADDTTEPLEGVVFNIKTYRVKRDGVVEDNDLGEYTTDAEGKIYIEKLKEDCKITATEVKEKDPTWYRWEEPFVYDIGHDATLIEALSETIENHQIRIGTSARFKESDANHYVADGVAHIIDTVDYEWLYEGNRYKLIGTLIDKGTEDEPSEKEVTKVEHEFVAKSLNGSEDVEIEFDFTDMENHDFVVFEELIHIVTKDVPRTDEEGNPVVDEEGDPIIDRVPTGEEPTVAEHKDIDDEGQSVHCDELYRALMVMYKTDASKVIRLNGAVFTVTTKRTKRDGSVVTGNLGRFVTGGIYYEQADAFRFRIARDEAMSEEVTTLASARHPKFGTQYVQITTLTDGVYYGQVEGETDVHKYVVARGMIYLEDQVEDTLITYHEEIAPEGYYLPGDDFICDVGHDDSITRIENTRPNSRIIRRDGDKPVIPHTGFDGEH